MKTLTSMFVLFALTGCASQQIAQRHWQWLTANQSGAIASHSSGVQITPVTVNGQTFQVVTPAR